MPRPSTTTRLLRTSLASIALLALTACGAPRLPEAKSKVTGPTRLTVLSINDFHGQIDARPVASRETPPRSLLLGGAEALAATIADLRAQNPQGTLLLDGGDFMQGSMVSNRFEGAPVRELYRLLKVDATVVGNHEFDFGPVGPRVTSGSPGDDPRGALRAWVETAPFPVLSANISQGKSAPLAWKNLRPHVILQRAGLRIGVVGLTTTHTPETTLGANVADLRFAELRKTALREAAALRDAGVAVRILLAHVGGSCKSEDPASCRGEIFDLVRSLPPRTFDLVISAHSHRCLRHRIAGTPVIQACALGSAIGHVDLWVEKGARRTSAKIHSPHPVCRQIFAAGGDCEAQLRRGPARGGLVQNPALKRHAALVKRVERALAPFREQTRPLERKVLTHVARPLNHRFAGGSEVGYLFARMMRRAVAGADIALINGGGIRGDMAAGPLTYGALYRIFPFDNRLATIRLTGAQLKRLLQASLKRTHGGVMQAAGLSATVRCGPGGERTIAALGDTHGRPLDDARDYLVVLADFLLAGGDGLASVMNTIPAARKKVLAERLIRDEMATYLRSRKDQLNTAQDPVLSADSPSIRLEESGCRVEKRAGRAICR